MTQESGQDRASQEAARAALHMRNAQDESKDALADVDNAITGVRELLRGDRDDGQ